MTDVIKEAINWLEWDQETKTRSVIKTLFENEEWDKLSNLLLKRMTFGTAGLRAQMGPGNCQLNTLTIIQTSQGLCKYANLIFSDLTEKGIIIGFDGRYNSKWWATITANIFVNAGWKVYLFRDPSPTPLVAFGVLHYKTCIGVVITASHNPKKDNGYKVYWSNGAQILSPHDKGISVCINQCLKPFSNSWLPDCSKNYNIGLNPMPEVLEAYCLAQKNTICYTLKENSNFKMPIVYTAMHGVGWKMVQSLVSSFNFLPLIPVDEQINPDPEFPTVDYPNPEEGRSSLNLAMKKANTVGSNLILANDPDADRLAVAEKQKDDKWKIFSGNEIGTLFGWWLWTNWRQRHPNESASKVAMLSSNVSSKILQSMARIEGFHFEETLTGFKWLANRALQLSATKGIRTIFAFEEAIGFMCSNVVLDKDGVSALVVMLELVSHVYRQSSLLTDQLEKIYAKYGLHISKNSYYFCNESYKMVEMFERIRNWPDQPTPTGYPKQLGRFVIKNIRDLTTGYDNNYEDKKARLPVSKSSQSLTFTFENGVTLTLRTSGTEPKIKYYSEICSLTSKGATRESLTNELNELIELMVENFYRLKENGFSPPVN